MDYNKLFRGTLISAVVGGLTYMMANLRGGELGEWTPFVVTGLGIVVNALKLAISKQR